MEEEDKKVFSDFLSIAFSGSEKLNFHDCYRKMYNNCQFYLFQKNHELYFSEQNFPKTEVEKLRNNIFWKCEMNNKNKFTYFPPKKEGNIICTVQNSSIIFNCSPTNLNREDVLECFKLNDNEKKEIIFNFNLSYLALSDNRIELVIRFSRLLNIKNVSQESLNLAFADLKKFKREIGWEEFRILWISKYKEPGSCFSWLPVEIIREIIKGIIKDSKYNFVPIQKSSVQ